jgi:glucose/arabinose dehydrogenase
MRHRGPRRSHSLGLAFTTISAVILSTSAAAIGPEGLEFVAATTADPVIELEPVVTGLDRPVLVTNAGDARLFVVEQGGRIRIVEGGALRATPFLDLTARISTGGERGLLGLAFHPGYAANRRFFVFYNQPDGDLQVSEFSRSSGDSSRADPASERPILRIEHSTYANHNGGMLAFGTDGYLYVGTGDGGGGGDPLGSGQNLGSRLGKILRIDVDTPSPSIPYEVPPTNPFVGKSGDDLIWAFGLRNPWRFSFDRSTGDLWIGDVGQGAWEEVDRARSADGGGRGVNYGWNVLEGDHCYGATSCDRAGKTPPLAEYPHGAGDCSVTGGYVYRGSAAPLLGGRYVFGDYCSGRIWSVIAGGGSPQSETLLLDSALRITSFGEDSVGEVYVTDIGGSVHRILETHVTRRSGGDRYATAAAVAATYPANVPVAYVATGENYPDAIAGGPAAARDGGPILLVRRDSIPSATSAALTRLKPGRIVVLGGTGAVSAGVATALVGYTAGP